MNRTTTGIVPCALALCLSGCAALAHHKERSQDNGSYLQQILVTSDPSGATVVVGGAVQGVTPLHVAISRREKHARLRFEIDGYETREVAIERGLSGHLAGDVLFGAIPWSPTIGLSDTGPYDPPSTTTRATWSVGIIGATLLIDIASGAAFTHPSSVHVRLTKKTTSRVASRDHFTPR